MLRAPFCFGSIVAQPLVLDRFHCKRRAVVGVVRASEKEVRCYVNEEGHLVCDRLEPGDYVVKRAEEALTEDQAGKPPEGAAFCYITDSGELICEGLLEGNYTIEQATDEHMGEMLSNLQELNKEKPKIVEEARNKEEEEEDLSVQESFDPETGVRCYVNADGVLVCEKLDPGDYFVKPLEGSEAKTGSENSDGVTYCYITDNGELICEGMKEGQYSIQKATDDDLENILKQVNRITEKSD